MKYANLIITINKSSLPSDMFVWSEECFVFFYAFEFLRRVLAWFRPGVSGYYIPAVMKSWLRE